ncbi:hypothetical protein JCM10212_006317 [Sporobolomyces blumeae]
MLDDARPPHVVIVGAGIIGLSTAYYTLSRSATARVTLLESSTSRQVAAGASSYAGGFIACGPSWHDPSSQDLARLSWDCHVELSRVLKGDETCGWRTCGAIGLNVGAEVSRSAYRTLPNGKGKELVEVEQGHLPRGEWVEGDKEELSLEGGVAQVDPAEFCQTLYRHLLATFPDRFTCRFGRPTAIERRSCSVDDESGPSTRKLNFTPLPEGEQPASPARVDILFDKLVIAAGPWSAQVCDTLSLPSLPITNLPGHSLLIRPGLDAFVPVDPADDQLPAQAVFAGIDGGVGGVHGDSFGLARGLSDEEKRRGYTRAPEFFTRKNGLVYVAGENSIPASASESDVGLPNKLPANVDEVKEMVDRECVERLTRAAGAVSPFLKVENGAKVEKTQFCYRPISVDREPIVGFVEKDVLVATGHGPWGITLGPGTGRVVAEMALKEQLSADVRDLSPARFATSKS